MKGLRILGVLLILTQGSFGWERLTDCKLLPNESNDGDSFHVEHEGKEYIFRLYFVDTPESSMQVESRVAQQAEDFGVPEDAVLGAGKEAAEFTEKLLRRRFEVLTRFENALGASRMGRSYAIIRTHERKDLGMLLVQNGWARAHGVAPDAPSSYKMTDYKRAEERARRNKLGIFGGRKLSSSETGEIVEPEPEVIEPVKDEPPPKEEEDASPMESFPTFNTEKAGEALSASIEASIAADTMAMATMGRSQSPENPREKSSASTPLAPNSSSSSVSASSSGGKISVNNATKEELESLPKIGPKMAQAIIDGRPYAKAAEIERVSGLGGKALQTILPLVTE